MAPRLIKTHRLRRGVRPFVAPPVVIAYVTSLQPGNDMADAPPDTRATTLYPWAMLFSPISPWGPVLFGSHFAEIAD